MSGKWLEINLIQKAKRIDNGEWVQGFYFCMIHSDGRHIHHFLIPLGTDLSLGTTIENIQVEIDESTLCRNFPCGGQSLDGLPIWENDIVTTDYGQMGIVRFGVYNSTYFGFYIEWLKEESYRKDIVYWLPKIKSIANIFDNPELLEPVNDYEEGSEL